LVTSDTFYVVITLVALAAAFYYTIHVRKQSVGLVESMCGATMELVKSIDILEGKIASIAVVNQRQIQNLETSLEAAKKRANAAESKLAALYSENPQLKRRRS